jgi:REP element-mobilizing transposase RayT
MRVVGFHFIFSAYGFWLPNDPRGSWSQAVRAFNLLRFGPATKVTTHRSLAGRKHDVQKRLAAKRALGHKPVRFNGKQARAIVRGFATARTEHDHTVHALAVLPDHVHMVMAWHRRHIDQIAAHLKAKATAQLNKEGIHPLAQDASPSGRMPSPWARNYLVSVYFGPRAYAHRHPLRACKSDQSGTAPAKLETGHTLLTRQVATLPTASSPPIFRIFRRLSRCWKGTILPPRRPVMAQGRATTKHRVMLTADERHTLEQLVRHGRAAGAGAAQM